MKKHIKEACDKWRELNFDAYKFRKYLKKSGWVDINKKQNGIFKYVFSKENIVIKFDMDGGTHTCCEYKSWLQSGAKRKKYICPALHYYKGLLFQPLLSNVCDNQKTVLKKIHILARKCRFSHFWNYGYLNGDIKFFDTDSLYYKITDKEERVY